MAFVGHVCAASSIFSEFAPLSLITLDFGFTLTFFSTLNTEGAIVSQLQHAIHLPGSTFTDTEMSFSTWIGSVVALVSDLTFS
jgi:hypothetical protein